ncbi:MAG TPA: hypothetical protein VND91_08650 [Candidatus Saccharimonadia bacterium]|nr:hypothetical protein [Candidatus Saccharimonadia bacterium]
MKTRFRLSIGSFLLLLGGLALAGPEPYLTRTKVEPARFGQLVEVLRDEMEPGGRFAYVTREERTRVETSLARMQEVLHGKASLADLDERERIAVLNAQEEVNAILTKRDSERLVCDRRLLPGSHRKETVCETYGDRMARIKGSREQVERLNRRIQACREVTLPGPAANSGSGGIVCQSG